MRKLVITAITILALMLVACGTNSNSTATNSTPQSAATITLGVGRFITTTATIKAGQAVTFDDSNGGPHNLVTGTNGTLMIENGAPSELSNSGLPFSGGDSKTVTFPTAGVFQITCTFHPSMAATVTVNP